MSRGVVLPAAAMSTILIHAARAETVPFSLIESTSRAATFVAAGPTAGTAVSAAVISLFEGVITTMFVAKLKGVALAVGIMTVIVSGGIALAQSGQPGSSGAGAGNKGVLLTSGTGNGDQAPQDDRTAAPRKEARPRARSTRAAGTERTPGGGSASRSQASSAPAAGAARADGRSQPSGGSRAGSADSAAPASGGGTVRQAQSPAPVQPGKFIAGVTDGQSKFTPIVNWTEASFADDLAPGNLFDRMQAIEKQMQAVQQRLEQIDGRLQSLEARVGGSAGAGAAGTGSAGGGGGGAPAGRGEPIRVRP